MPSHRKLRRLQDLQAKDVARPKSLWLAYAVCACSARACEWEGWLLDGVFTHASAKFQMDLPKGGLLEASDRQRCPRCGRQLFRTEVSYEFEVKKSGTKVRLNVPRGRVLPSISMLKRATAKRKTLRSGMKKLAQTVASIRADSVRNGSDRLSMKAINEEVAAVRSAQKRGRS